MATENLIDVVEQLQTIVADFKRLLYGDHATRSSGLLAEFDSLRKEVSVLRTDVQKLQQRRPNVWAWIAGYFAFVGAVAFGMVAFLNQVDTHNVWNLPPELALWMAAGLAVFALFLFMQGFGWFDR